MELPNGWKVGEAKNVTCQWSNEWPEYVGKASTTGDVLLLRGVLEERKGWLFPRTVRRFSRMLQDRAKLIGLDMQPVVSDLPDKPWHARLTDYPDFINVAPSKSPTADEAAEIAKRMTGERDDD